jgi:hypothetical protein
MLFCGLICYRHYCLIEIMHSGVYRVQGLIHEKDYDLKKTNIHNFFHKEQ